MSNKQYIVLILVLICGFGCLIWQNVNLKHQINSVAATSSETLDEARTARENSETAATNSSEAADTARQAADNANEANDTARQAADNADDAKRRADDAATALHQ